MGAKKTIVIAGGGTGGHIYPALAIARALQKIEPEVLIHFVGTSEGLEKKIVPREGFSLHLIQAGKLNFSGRIWQKILTLIKIPVGLIESFFLLKKLNPSFVLGVGGYASGPFVLMAALCRYPTGLWEANAHPGMANRWLSRFVDICFVVFKEAQGFFKATVAVESLGMPLRSEIEQGQKTNISSSDQDRKFRLLCFGGSQGARAINQVLSEVLLKHPKLKEKLEVVHQIGSTDWKIYEQKYQAQESWIRAFEFIYDMPKYYEWADLVLCRGGASTLAEVCAFGVVPVVVPLPAADAHQESNARSLVQAGAARMILQKDLTVDVLLKEIDFMISNSELRQQMALQLKSLYQPAAADRIAKKILEFSKHES